VIFEWKDQLGQHVIGGFSHDVSTKGLRLICKQLPPLNASGDLHLMLPPAHNSSHSVQLQAAGKVARILSSAEGPGVAITAELDIDDAEEQQSAG
jgi:hypothetical protein